jgi:molybdopterin-guanine dinucleotide biosynthesis protein A
MPDSAGVVLAGGRSSRMGTPKAALEWHGSTLLRRTVGILARATGGPVVVVRANGQELPELPSDIKVIDDPRQGKGPVQGIAAGLAAVADRAGVAFVSSTDMPFLHPAFVRRVLRAVHEGADVGLPVARGYPQPLAAAYKTSLAPIAERLVRADRLRPAFLFEQCTVTRLDEATLKHDPVLAALDPELASVVNVNEPDDYRTARDQPAPPITVQRFGVLASGPDGHTRPETVRAATVAEAAAAAGVDFGGGHVTAALNGDQITRDGQTPLAAGDTVFFLSADAGG